MAKLQKYELDAIVETIIEQIDEKMKDSPEQVEYKRLCQLEKDLEKAATKEYKAFRKQLVEKYTKLADGLTVDENNYNGISIYSPNQPKSSVNYKQIERDIIMANISGNVEETVQKIVTKYTTN